MWSLSQNSDRKTSFLSETGSSIPPPPLSSYTYLADSESENDEFSALLSSLKELGRPDNCFETASSIPVNEELYGGSKDEQLDNITESDVVVPQLGGGGDDISASHLQVVESNDGVTNTRRIVKKKTSGRNSVPMKRTKIGVEKLRLQFGKTLKEAASCLEVSVSTLKRICRKYEIPSWPKKRDLYADIIDEQALGQITNPISDMQLETEIQPVTGKFSIVTAKVQYDVDAFIKFEISSASKLAHLQYKISKRLNLMDGSFNIKYVDEDEDLVLITNDDDVALCMRSLKTANVKMQVSLCSN